MFARLKLGLGKVYVWVSLTHLEGTLRLAHCSTVCEGVGTLTGPGMVLIFLFFSPRWEDIECA